MLPGRTVKDGRRAKPEDVDSYIAEADPKARPMLEELRELIRSTVPGVEEGISYGVPFYKHHGEFVGFAAFKNHVSFGFGSHVVPAGDRTALEADGYKLGKGTMQIRFDQDVPSGRGTRDPRGEGAAERGRAPYVTGAASTARRAAGTTRGVPVSGSGITRHSSPNTSCTSSAVTTSPGAPSATRTPSRIARIRVA